MFGPTDFAGRMNQAPSLVMKAAMSERTLRPVGDVAAISDADIARGHDARAGDTGADRVHELDERTRRVLDLFARHVDAEIDSVGRGSWVAGGAQEEERVRARPALPFLAEGHFPRREAIREERDLLFCKRPVPYRDGLEVRAWGRLNSRPAQVLDGSRVTGRISDDNDFGEGIRWQPKIWIKHP